MSMDDVLSAARMCGFCGFCEHVCPTYILTRRRHYGPRGRVAAAEQVARGAEVSHGLLESLYTCLLCRACLYECPTGIDVAELVRSARAIRAARGGSAGGSEACSTSLEVKQRSHVGHV